MGSLVRGRNKNVFTRPDSAGVEMCYRIGVQNTILITIVGELNKGEEWCKCGYHLCKINSIKIVSLCVV